MNEISIQMKEQLNVIKESSKDYKGIKRINGQKSIIIILATNIVKLENLTLKTLKDLESTNIGMQKLEQSNVMKNEDWCMKALIKLMEEQLKKISQSIKHFTNGNTGKKGVLILSSNLIKFKNIISFALKELQSVGADINKIRRSLK